MDAILVSAGRQPNVEGLNLEAAGVECDSSEGVQVDDGLRTTASRIYACGDVCLPGRFTHAADAAARIVIQNALFRRSVRPAAPDRLTIPCCTYTDPEIAHVGIHEADAQERGIELDTYRQPLDTVDRAITDGETEGFVKIHTRKGTGYILGATIVARHAGEMIIAPHLEGRRIKEYSERVISPATAKPPRGAAPRSDRPRSASRPHRS